MAEHEHVVSGEQYREMQSKRPKGTVAISSTKIILGAVGVVLLGAGFFGGVAYQKGHQTETAPTTLAAGNFPGGNNVVGGQFGGQRPEVGSVSAVSDTSITVKSQRSGTSTTLTIDSSTAITDNGQTVAASDIQTGDNVLVTADSSDSTKAARILVNPSFGGEQGATNSTGDNGPTTTMSN